MHWIALVELVNSCLMYLVGILSLCEVIQCPVCYFVVRRGGQARELDRLQLGTADVERTGDVARRPGTIPLGYDP